MSRTVIPPAQGDDHLIELVQPARPFGTRRGLERAQPVPREVQVDVPDLGRDRLRSRPVTRVRERRGVRVTLLVAEVVGEFDLRAALEAALIKPDEPAIPGQIDLAGIDAGEQTVQSARSHQVSGSFDPGASARKHVARQQTACSE